MLSKRYKADGIPTFEMNGLQLEMKEQIDRKVREGIYRFESVPCCICKGEIFEPLSNKDRYGLLFPVVICRTCGLIQTNPRMDRDSYNTFYNLEYRNLYSSSHIPTREFFSTQYEVIGKKIYDHLKNGGFLEMADDESTVIEIGCGAGGILKLFHDKGFKTYGVDVGKKYVEYGREKFGIELSVTTIENILIDKRADIVIYSHVFEHLLDPNTELLHIQKLLKDDGIVYIEVPGVRYICENPAYQGDFLRLLQNAHTYHFTKTSFNNLARKNGFKMITGDEAMVAVITKDLAPKENWEPVNDYDSAMAYLIDRERQIE